MTMLKSFLIGLLIPTVFTLLYLNYRLSDRVQVQAEQLRHQNINCRSLKTQLDQCLAGWKRSSDNFDSVSDQAYRAIALVKRWEAICDSLVEVLHARGRALNFHELYEDRQQRIRVPDDEFKIQFDTTIFLEAIINFDTK